MSRRDNTRILIDARLRTPSGKPALTFKGCTSLSKAHNLIRRFLENIDITLFREDLQQAALIEEMEKLSGKKRRAKLDAIRDACRTWVAGPSAKPLLAKFQNSPAPLDKSDPSFGFAILYPFECRIGSTAPSRMGFRNLLECRDVARGPVSASPSPQRPLQSGQGYRSRLRMRAIGV